MELFRNAQTVRLRSPHGYLVAEDDKETVALRRDEKTAVRGDNDFSDRARWSVEFVLNSDSVLRLKSCHGKYLAASDKPSRIGMTGCQVLQSLPPLLDSEWEPMMEGTHVKLRTHYGSFLCTGRDSARFSNAVIQDLPHHTTFLWDVEVVMRKEGSATYIDNIAWVEGSASNIDDKAPASNIEDEASEKGSASKRRHETGEGSSVTKSPPGVSALIREGDGVTYRSHFWKLRSLLWDDSGRKDVLVMGGSGTTALVREVCADVQENFGTIAYISIPQKNDSESIREEILLQLIFERATFPKDCDSNFWMTDYEFSLKQKARCLIVVDNLDDERTWKKFKEVLRIVKTCRVIFIARRKMGSSDSQISQYDQICQCGREFVTYHLGDLSFVPWAHYLMNFPEKGSPSKRLCELVVSKCQRLPTAIVFVLHKKENLGRFSSYKRKDEWEARIPSVDLCPELHVIQQVLGILQTDDHLFRLLYLSILPENKPIGCNTVSRLWAAEGFLTDLGRAELFLDVLLSKDCIYAVERRNGELSTFQVDKRVREILVSLSNLRDQVITTSRNRYLSVRGTIKALNKEKTFELSSIFVPDVSSNDYETTTSKASPWEDLKHSKVLDLTGASFRIVPDELFQLTDVRYLSLRNTSIKVIPGSIRKLTSLEFLDAKNSLITKLPQQFARLKKIRHILIYHYEKDPLMESYSLIGFKSLCSITGLKCLEKLCFVEADERTLEDIGTLTKLRRLGITKLRKEHGGLLCTSLEKLKKLKSLNVHALDEDEILDLHNLSSPPASRTLPLKSLKHLYLHGRLEKLPDWISSHDGLTKIILRWSQLKEDLLATLGKLQNLVELELHRAYVGERLDFKIGQFPTVKILLLEESEGLRSMSFEQGTLRCLENLTISRCHWLERIPSGIELISSIKRLTFFDMSHEFYKKVREDLEKDDSEKFKRIPEVYFTRWRAGHWEPHQVESTDGPHCSHQVQAPVESVLKTSI